MSDSENPRRLLRDLFREEVLLIGSLAATHEISDDFLWALCRNLDLIRIRFMRKLKPAKGFDEDLRLQPKSKPHPAVQELLRKIAENK